MKYPFLQTRSTFLLESLMLTPSGLQSWKLGVSLELHLGTVPPLETLFHAPSRPDSTVYPAAFQMRKLKAANVTSEGKSGRQGLRQIVNHVFPNVTIS